MAKWKVCKLLSVLVVATISAFIAMDRSFSSLFKPQGHCIDCFLNKTRATGEQISSESSLKMVSVAEKTRASRNGTGEQIISESSLETDKIRAETREQIISESSLEKVSVAEKIRASRNETGEQIIPESSLEKVSVKKDLKLAQKSVLYGNWKLFELDYRQMLKKFKVYVYPEAFDSSNPLAHVFVAHGNPYDRKLGNYFSEHMFKINLLNSSFLTRNPAEAHLFFMPFSVNVIRNDPRLRAQGSIGEFVAKYVEKISEEFKFWNRTDGADHFHAGCHSVGRDAASNSRSLQKNAIQVTCSANYYYKFYVPHKDVPMPQVWPRLTEVRINPPHKRTRLAFFAGRAQNSVVRQSILQLWSNDLDMDIYGGTVPGSYEEFFSKSKFCLHVKGYEVNTARISDAIHFGCVPVIISNHYDLPLSNILNWKSFSVIVSYADIPSLKAILRRISDDEYAHLHANVCEVKKHFRWRSSPEQYDSFHMTMYELWLKRNLVRPLL